MGDKFNIDVVKQQVMVIQQYINKYPNKDEFDLEMEIMESLPEFYEDYPFLVKKLCKRDDVSMLYTMIEKLEAVEKGDESLATVEYNLGNNLAEKYLQPVIDKLDK
jgi:hypothetical protein